MGGKAAQLSELVEPGPVPPGFCLTTRAWELAAGHGAGPAEPRQLTPKLLAQLAEAYRQLGERCGAPSPSVAVRSSAIDEDSAAASFAGQYATYLNVVGPDAIAEAVLRCWASARSPHALDYRRRQGLAGGEVPLAVLVQQLVQADLSAVVFSLDPVSGERDDVLINAAWGFGESLVGGTVTPDTFRVRRADLTVERRVAQKRRMTVLVEGGTREVKVPRFLRDRPSLTDAQAVELAHLAIDLERRCGYPVDLECAYQGDALFLLQCRPVTAV